jgi:hypothetical protein
MTAIACAACAAVLTAVSRQMLCTRQGASKTILWLGFHLKVFSCCDALVSGNAALLLLETATQAVLVVAMH